jgi:beta-lactamase regulating signal transducer with metallopeptidase domain
MSFPIFEFPPLFELLLQASWQAGLLVFIVLAMQRTLRCRLTPAWRHALWWVVLGRLLIPITPPSTWSLFNLIPTPANERILSQGSLASSSGWQPVVARSASGDSVENLKPAAPRAVDLELTPSPGAPGASPAMSIGGVMALAWAVVALFLLCRIGFQNLWFSRRVHSSMQPADPDLLTVLDECRSRMRIKRRIDLLQGDAVSSPAVFGILRPKILLPRQLASTCQTDQLRHILLHELAHIRRGDPLVHGLTRVLQALHWFNPVHTWAFRRLRADREIATDALALEIAGEQESRAYGLTIVQLLQRWVAHPAQPNTVGILEDDTSLERRIRAIATYRRPSRWAPVASLLVAALAAASWTSAQTDGSPKAASLPPLIGTLSTEQLLKEASQQMESGDLDAARRKVEAALAMDPKGERANHILKLIQDGYSAVEAQRRNNIGELGLRQIEKSDQLASETQSNFASRPKATSKDRQRIMALLESIRIPEVGFDRLPLEDVVRKLRDLARAHDPEGKGINFVMNPYLDNVPRPDSKAVIDPDTGTPSTPNPAEPTPLNDIIVRIEPPLRDVRLLDVLRAISLSASTPILFIVEDYAVVFAHKPPRHATLVTRVFSANPERLSTGLESTIRILGRTNGVASADDPATSPTVQEKVRRFFQDLGVNLLPPNALFFNERLGLLMVRAPMDEIEIVENAIEVLNQGTVPVWREDWANPLLSQTGASPMGPFQVPISRQQAAQGTLRTGTTRTRDADSTSHEFNGASAQSEPSYEGKTLSAWLKELQESPTWSLYGVGESNQPPVSAIRAIGPRAVPFLLDAFKPDDASLVRACIGFRVLGRMGKTAIPSLLRLVDRYPGYAPSALASIGAPAVPALKECLNNNKAFGEHIPIPGNTMGGMFNAISLGGVQAAEFLPLLPEVRELADSTNSHAARYAASLLARIQVELTLGTDR